MVSNLINNRGNAVANQFVISELGAIKFQSYQSLVCVITSDTITFGRDWDYSRTTMKHLHTFLDDNRCGFESSQAIRKAIEKGEHNGYKVVYDSEMR